MFKIVSVANSIALNSSRIFASLGDTLKGYLNILIDYYGEMVDLVPLEKSSIIFSTVVGINKMAKQLTRCDNLSFQQLYNFFDKFKDKQEVTFLSLRRGLNVEFLKKKLNEGKMLDDDVIDAWISVCCLEKEGSDSQGNRYALVALRNDLDEEAIKKADSLVVGAYCDFVEKYGKVENYLYHRDKVLGKDRMKIEVDIFDALSKFYPEDNMFDEVPFVSWNHFHTTEIKDGLEVAERYKSTAHFFSVTDVDMISGDIANHAFLEIIGITQRQSVEIREILRANGILDNNYRINDSIDLYDDKIDLKLGEKYSKYQKSIIETLKGFLNPLRMDSEVFSSLGIGFIDNSYSYIDVNGAQKQLQVNASYKTYVNRLLVFRDVYSYLSRHSKLQESGKVDASLLIRDFWMKNISKEETAKGLERIGLEQELVERFRNDSFEGPEQWRTFFGIQRYYPELDALKRGHLSYFVSRSRINRMLKETDLGRMQHHEAIEFIKLKSTKLLRMMICEKYDLSDLFIRDRKFFGNRMVSVLAKNKYKPLFRKLWNATSLNEAREARDNILKVFDDLYKSGELYGD